MILNSEQLQKLNKCVSDSFYQPVTYEFDNENGEFINITLDSDVQSFGDLSQYVPQLIRSMEVSEDELNTFINDKILNNFDYDQSSFEVSNFEKGLRVLFENELDSGVLEVLIDSVRDAFKMNAPIDSIINELQFEIEQKISSEIPGETLEHVLSNSELKDFIAEEGLEHISKIDLNENKSEFLRSIPYEHIISVLDEYPDLLTEFTDIYCRENDATIENILELWMAVNRDFNTLMNVINNSSVAEDFVQECIDESGMAYVDIDGVIYYNIYIPYAN